MAKVNRSIHEICALQARTVDGIQITASNSLCEVFLTLNSLLNESWMNRQLTSSSVKEL